MVFFSWLVIINLACFLPLYFINARQQPNPFAFLNDKRLRSIRKLKLLYTKLNYSDPFHVNADFVITVLVLLILNAPLHWVLSIATLVLLFGMLEITYTSIMTFVFDRPPAFASDMSLLKSGWVIWKSKRSIIVLTLVTLITIFAVLSYQLCVQLLTQSPPATEILIAGTALILLPTLFHWRQYDYKTFHSRTFYSPLLHCWRNWQFGRQYQRVFSLDRDFYATRNLFKHVSFKPQPNIVHLCIESYGDIVYRPTLFTPALKSRLQSFEQRLRQKGFYIASSASQSPIFSGGSWLSYASLMYGTRLDNLHLYDGLFQYSDNFEVYESLFHILKRNGYQNVLAAPMGGVHKRDVNWQSIRRCFQSDQILDWASYAYQGKPMRFFNQKDRVCLPDQYALNFAYNKLQSANESQSPLHLFYCTMNSHLPYESPVQVEADWRNLNNSDYAYPITDKQDPLSVRYLQAIDYQLDLIVDFIEKNSREDLILCAFGDHQPPLVATEKDGRNTPIHIISNNPAFHSVWRDHGFQDGLIIKPNEQSIRHEAYMSMFLNAMVRVYGHNNKEAVPISATGTLLFDEVLSKVGK